MKAILIFRSTVTLVNTMTASTMIVILQISVVMIVASRYKGHFNSQQMLKTGFYLSLPILTGEMSLGQTLRLEQHFVKPKLLTSVKANGIFSLVSTASEPK